MANIRPTSVLQCLGGIWPVVFLPQAEAWQVGAAPSPVWCQRGAVLTEAVRSGGGARVRRGGECVRGGGGDRSVLASV